MCFGDVQNLKKNHINPKPSEKSNVFHHPLTMSVLEPPRGHLSRLPDVDTVRLQRLELGRLGCDLDVTVIIVMGFI